MTRAQLEKIGRWMFGRSWLEDMANVAGRNVRTIYEYRKGTQAIPDDVSQRIHEYKQKHIEKGIKL